MIQTSRLPQGYKDSALEVIPKDWRVKKLGEVFLQLKNFSFSRDQMTDAYQKLRYIHYGDIHVSLLKDSLNMQKDSLPFIFDGLITNEKLNNEDFPYLQNGDIILVDASEDYEGIGKLWEIINTANKKIISGLHTIPLRCFTNEVFVGFGRYVFKNPQSAISLKKIAQGTKVYSISYNNISKLSILLPPLPEQQKIAEILSLWYEAIEKQTQLIAQLETRKRGLMQQLLTGKKRLKGFSGEWKKVKIGEIGDVFSGGTPDTTNMSYWNGNINWCTPTDISALNEEKYIGNTITKITQEGLNNSSAILLPKGSIIVCTRATIGKVVITNEDISTNQGFKNIVPNKKINTEFLYYSLLSLETTLLRLGNGSTFLEVSKKDFKNIQIFCPAFSEQTAIANILSISDNELSLSKQKLAGLKDQKKGLIQQLLTGKKRIKLL